MSRRGRSRGGPRLAPNLTPMVDVVFLLLIFFVLVAQISGAERVEMPLPRLFGVAEAPRGPERRIVVNIAPREEGADAGVWARVGTIEIPFGEAGEARLAETLLEARRLDPNLRVIVRASRDEASSRVLPALEACRVAGLPGASLATRAPDG